MNIPLFFFFPRDEDEIIPLSAIPNSERIKCCEKTSDASYKQHLECLKKLRSEGVEWDMETIHYAVLNNNLEILKYAHENGCSWGEYTTSSATHYNHLDCLLYCLENGCPIHPETLNKLYKRPWGVLNEINMNLLTNLLLRKILLHSKIKNDISEKYPAFLKAIKEYEEYINKVYKLLHLKTTLPTDIIKYELLKYI